MIFDNSTIRRKDRTLDEARCLELLKNSEYGVLSLSDETCGGYGIPISFVWDEQSALYFHCAPEGKKIDIIETNNNASFCIVGKRRVISHQFTTEYESVIFTGKVVKVIPDEEKMNALSLILDKYCPKDKVIGIEYAKKSFHRTQILRFDIDSFSGKAKSVKPE